jgi:predicted DNA-binding WGR domain protein
MTNLLILMSNILDDSDRVGAILNDYKKNGLEIAVLEHQRDLSAEAVVSRCIQQMAIFPVNHVLVCAKGVGCRAYWLSQHNSAFPTLRKVKSQQCPSGDLLEEGEHWDEIDVPGFAKPKTGLIDLLLLAVQPEYTLLVCDSALDRETSSNLGRAHPGGICQQSVDEWLTRSNPQPWQSWITQPTPSSPVRRLEYINPAQNSYKFWEIVMRPDGMSFETRYGRIGTKGQSKVKTFPNRRACQVRHSKMIHLKLRKGYVEV